jgi:hypothetical protein
MRSRPVSTQSQTVDEDILALRRPRIMFSALADALPFHTWHTLFCALGRLSRQQCVELIAHRWDYEVVFLPKAAQRTISSSLPQG